MEQARADARALRNTVGSGEGDDPYLTEVIEWEEGEQSGVYRHCLLDSDLAAHSWAGGAGPPYRYPRGIEINVADDCTMAEVPPFEGQQMADVAIAIMRAGRTIFDLCDEVERLTERNKDLDDVAADMARTVERLNATIDAGRRACRIEMEPWDDDDEEITDSAMAAARIFGALGGRIDGGVTDGE